MRRTVTVTRFKAECLALIEEIATSGEPLVVTKHGKPVVEVSPVARPTPLLGSVTFHVDDEALIAPIEEHWDAER